MSENSWMETARQYANNADYYRGLVVKIGEIIGEESYIADDGGVSEDVLCAKVPELVEEMKKRLEETEQAKNDEMLLHAKRRARIEELKKEFDQFYNIAQDQAMVIKGLESALAVIATATSEVHFERDHVLLEKEDWREIRDVIKKKIGSIGSKK